MILLGLLGPYLDVRPVFRLLVVAKWATLRLALTLLRWARHVPNDDGGWRLRVRKEAGGHWTAPGDISPKVPSPACTCSLRIAWRRFLSGSYNADGGEIGVLAAAAIADSMLASPVINFPGEETWEEQQAFRVQAANLGGLWAFRTSRRSSSRQCRIYIQWLHGCQVACTCEVGSGVHCANPLLILTVGQLLRAAWVSFELLRGKAGRGPYPDHFLLVGDMGGLHHEGVPLAAYLGRHDRSRTAGSPHRLELVLRGHSGRGRPCPHAHGRDVNGRAEVSRKGQVGYMPTSSVVRSSLSGHHRRLQATPQVVEFASGVVVTSRIHAGDSIQDMMNYYG